MDNNNMNQPQDNYQQPQANPYQQSQANPYQQPQGSSYQQPQVNSYQQPAYQQPVNVNMYQQPVADDTVSIGNWILSMLVMAVPCVNIVMMFVWAFSSSTPKSKSNFFKAYLILFAIGFVLGIIIYAIAGAALISSLN